MHISKRARFGLLLLWLFGILFPMAWLGDFSSRYRQVFNTLFSSEWMHWLMHEALYAGLVILLVLLLDLPLIRRTVLLVLGVALLVGLLQEGLQLFSGAQVLHWNNIFDLGVDLAGAALGVLVIAVFRQVHPAART